MLEAVELTVSRTLLIWQPKRAAPLSGGERARMETMRAFALSGPCSSSRITPLWGLI
jgi:ABC-type lipopolysaccharide export system ATPase subunit